jgi:elongation factor Ts
MTITAAEVNKLRQQTGAGLMDCKKALVESEGDFDAAIDYLRKKGQKVAEKRAGREANEGVVLATATEDRKFGVIINLSCETDFVAKNEDFVNFTKSIAELALTERPASKEELLALQLNGVTVGEKVAEQVGRIGEKIELADYLTMTGETVVPYIHAGYKIGVLTAMNKNNNPEIDGLGRDVSMQIAAMSPIAVDKEGVDQTTIQKEIEIGKEQAKAEGKPEHLLEKIAMGKLNKFFKENTLINQQFVKDGSKTVGQVLKELDPELQVVSFKRVALG